MPRPRTAKNRIQRSRNEAQNLEDIISESDEKERDPQETEAYND